MRLILHIGTHKTGTTSIQKFCARHRAPLRAQGLWYPDYDLIGKEGHYAHHHLANALAGLPTSRGLREDAFAFLSRARSQARQGETVLISAESFWRHVVPPVALIENEYDADGGGETYWSRRRAFVDLVRRAAGDAEITVVLRRQDDCAVSMFKERVKGTSYADTFDRFLRAFAHRFAYFDQVSVWKEFFDHVRVLVYEDLNREGDLVSAFFRQLEIPIQVDGAAERRNPALGNDLIEFKRRLNTTGLSEDALWEIALTLQRRDFAEGIELDGGTSLWGDARQRSDFLEQFGRQNTALLEAFFPPGRSALFSAPNLSERAYGGLSEERSGAIAARLKALGAVRP